MNRNEILNYEAPLVEVIEVEVEKGFAVSGQWFSNEKDWDQTGV